MKGDGVLVASRPIRENDTTAQCREQRIELLVVLRDFTSKASCCYDSAVSVSIVGLYSFCLLISDVRDCRSESVFFSVISFFLVLSLPSPFWSMSLVLVSGLGRFTKN